MVYYERGFLRTIRPKFRAAAWAWYPLNITILFYSIMLGYSRP